MSKNETTKATLKLRLETLRVLTASELRLVAGAGPCPRSK